MKATEFDCIDCNVHVYSWAGRINDRCMVCQWIYDQPELTQKEIDEIRFMTGTPLFRVEAPVEDDMANLRQFNPKHPALPENKDDSQ
jgi:hypothetical protein